MTGEEYARQKRDARYREYYLAHREEILERQKKKRQESPTPSTAKHRAQMKAWREANAEKVVEYGRWYREIHREELKVKARERMRAKRAKLKEEAQHEQH